MQYLIGLAIIIGIIYLIIKLIIFLAPFIFKGVLAILVVGGVLGLFVGVFYGIKNYMASTHENISHGALKIAMMVITSVFVLGFLGNASYLVYSRGGDVVDTISSAVYTPKPKKSKTQASAVASETFTNKIVNTDALNVRSGPSANHSIKFKLYRNNTVRVSDKDKSGEWVKIQHNNREGYVNEKFLR